MPRRKPKARDPQEEDSLSFSVLPRAAHDPERSKTGGSEFVLVPSNQAAENAVLSGMLDDRADEDDEARGDEDGVGRPGAGGARAVDEMGFPIDGYDYQQHLSTTGGGRFILPDGTVIEGGTQEASETATPAAAASAGKPKPTPFASDAIHMPGEGMRAHGLLEGVTLGGDALPDDLREAMEAAEAEAVTDDEGDDKGDDNAGGAGAGEKAKTGATNEVAVDGFEELNDDFLVMAAGVAPVGAGWEKQVDVTSDGRLAVTAEEDDKAFDFDAHLRKLMAAAGDDEGEEDEFEDDIGEGSDEEEISLEEFERRMEHKAQQQAGAVKKQEAAAELAAAVEATAGDGAALVKLGHSLDDGMDLVLAQFGEDAIGDPGEDAEAEEELRLLRDAAGDDQDRQRRLAMLAGEDVSDDEDDQEDGDEDGDDIGSLADRDGVHFAARSVRSGRSRARSSRMGGSAAGGMSVAESMSVVAMRAAEVLAERVESSKLNVRMPSLNAMVEAQEIKEHNEAIARKVAEEAQAEAAAEPASGPPPDQATEERDAFAAGLAAADLAQGGEQESKLPEDDDQEGDAASSAAGSQDEGFGSEPEDDEELLMVDDLPALRTTILPDGSKLRIPVEEVYSTAHKRLAEGHTISHEGALKVKEATLRLHAAMAERDAAEELAIARAREKKQIERAKAQADADDRASKSTIAFAVTLPNTSFGGVGADPDVPSAGDRAIASHFGGYLASKKATEDCETVLTGLSTTSNLPTVVDNEPNTRRQARKQRQLREQQLAMEQKAMQGGLELVDEAAEGDEEEDGRDETEPGRIVLSSRLGIPMPASRGIAKESASAAGSDTPGVDETGETVGEEEEAEEDEEEEQASTSAVIGVRRRGESKEEKKARKQAAKALRAHRREMRRGVRDTFKKEGRRQEAAAAGERSAARLGREIGSNGALGLL